MADATYTPKVYIPQGADTLVVASGGKIKVETGAAIVPNSGTQASAVVSIGTSSGTFTAAERAKFNSLLIACRGVGIVAP